VLWDVEEFADAVAPEGAMATESPLPVANVAPPELPAHEQAALKGVGFEPTEVDVIAGRSGVGVRELLSALVLLELKGYVRRDAGGAFVRTAP
jgi:DNA processing protein